VLHQLIPAPAAPVAARFELFSWLGRSLYIPSNAGASECLKNAKHFLFSKRKILVIPRLMNNFQHVAFDDLRLQPCWFAMASGRGLQKKLRWRWLTGSNGSQNRFYGSALRQEPEHFHWKFLEMLLGQNSQNHKHFLKIICFDTLKRKACYSSYKVSY
jgi:hypothetical protein